MSIDWNRLWPTLAAIAIILGVVPIIGLYMTFIERKWAAWIQDRVGPNRVGPLGLLQAVADGIKIFLKEQVIPSHVHRPLYLIAPTIGLLCALLSIAVVPFGPVGPEPKGGFRAMVAPGVDIGLLFLMAISSLSAYGIILGGWASNNKYSLYGALRSCAQFISYEIPLGLSILGIVMVTGSLNMEQLVAAQGPGIASWNVWWQPLAAILFFVAALAETNRLPFDLPECEQELVGGFHTEYSGIKFVLFFLAEYTHVVTISFLTVLLFFGGWHFPGLTGAVDATWLGYGVRWLVLLAKVAVVVGLIIQLRWTLPRFRFDQLMALAWGSMIPLGIFNFLAAAAVITFGWNRWWLAPLSLLAMALAAFWKARTLANPPFRRPSSLAGSATAPSRHQQVVGSKS